MSFSQGTIRVLRAASIRAGALVIFIIALLSFGEKQEAPTKNMAIPNLWVATSALQLHKIEGRWYYNTSPFNGYAISCHENGQMASKTGYLDGKREGTALKWHANGNLASQRTYIENRAEGTTTTWWPNGCRSSASQYRNRERHGVQKKWYPNGQLAQVMNFNAGREEGMQRAWLPNGKLYVNYEAKNGRFFGLKRSNLCYQLKNEVVQK